MTMTDPRDNPPREPIGTEEDTWLPIGHDGFGAPIHTWQVEK